MGRLYTISPSHSHGRSANRGGGAGRCIANHSIELRHDDPRLARAGTVELAEINRLPGAELETAIADKNTDTAAHHAGFDVGRGVAFAVAVRRRTPGDGLVERVEDVGDNIGIGILVDGDAGGAMRCLFAI